MRAVRPARATTAMSIRRAFHDKPWLFVVVGVALFTGLFFVFVLIAVLNPPDLI